MRDYRVNVAIGDFSFYVQAENQEEAERKAEEQLNDYVATVQDQHSNFGETQPMWITDVDDDGECVEE